MELARVSPAASPEILHHTVRRTWLFIAYSDEDDHTTNSHYLADTFLFERLGETTFWAWGDSSSRVLTFPIGCVSHIRSAVFLQRTRGRESGTRTAGATATGDRRAAAIRGLVGGITHVGSSVSF